MTSLWALNKQERRARLEKELGAKQRALPAKRYGVILADPPWRFEPYSRITGLDRAADNHYPTMTTASIAAMPIAGIAAKDSVLFLWATVPMLPHALLVMNAWGFTYRSSMVWIKTKAAHGFWFRNQHELLLIGARGNPPAPALGTQYSSVLQAATGRHSAKPEQVLKMIEHYYPTLPRVELFARSRRCGWDCWGAEAPNGNGKK